MTDFQPINFKAQYDHVKEECRKKLRALVKEALNANCPVFIGCNSQQMHDSTVEMVNIAFPETQRPLVKVGSETEEDEMSSSHFCVCGRDIA